MRDRADGDRDGVDALGASSGHHKGPHACLLACQVACVPPQRGKRSCPPCTRQGLLQKNSLALLPAAAMVTSGAMLHASRTLAGMAFFLPWMLFARLCAAARSKQLHDCPSPTTATPLAPQSTLTHKRARAIELWGGA